ncbi:MAG: serine hydrolase [Bacilli bacterium]
MMKRNLFVLFIFLFSFNVYADVTGVNKEVVSDFTPSAKSSILIEASTGDVIYSKNIEEKAAMASLTKVMTLLLTMEALEDKTIFLTDDVYVSKNAASMGGSQIYIGENNKIKLLDLLKGIGIASANDAAVAVAEHVSGNEEKFVLMMNDKAKKLGLKNTVFKNSHGLDEEGHFSSAEDLAIIARELVKYPLILSITSTYEEYLKINGENRWLVNTNKVVYSISIK